MRIRPLPACLALATAGASPLSAQVVINEIRIDQAGTDNDEFFELAGPPGASLDGLTYIVIGDGSAGSGVIEEATSLDGLEISGTGFFVAAESTFTLATADLTTSLNFENDDNVTHLLVSGFTGSVGQDLDPNNDGVLDLTPWTAVLDRVAVIMSPNPPSGTEWHYGPPTVGPDLGFVPGAVYRFPDGASNLSSWNIADFDDPTLLDTPGDPNFSGEMLFEFGGIQSLVVDVGPAYAGDLYLVLTNFTGTTPGFSVAGIPIPLNFDLLIEISLVSANSALFVNNVGTLDANGRGFAALNLPVLPPGASGLGLNSAAVILDSTTMYPTFATDPVPLDIF
ncbi:MAG TPA: hypothetical protein VKF62_09280 [Planctomycetota bacterium]|nr:hypothetical protein [Planctomycetota bacterium]